MKKIFLLALLIVTTYSCDDFEGWNVDTKNPSEVPPAFLITGAQQDIFQQMVGMNVNSNNFGMMSQMWGQSTYQDEAMYLFRERDFGGAFWTRHYYILADLQEAAKLITEESVEDAGVVKNQLAMIDLMSIYSWSVLVDTYGYIPYSEALQGNGNLVPKYDSGQEIYNDLFRRLDVALNSLDDSNAMGSVASGDLVYDGDVASWKMFGNSLKLRMALRVADADAAMSKTKAEEAAAAGVLMSNAYNATFPFESTTPNTNPNWVTLVQSGRTDYLMAEQFVDMIVPLNDPRTPVYMDDNVVPYIGGVYGTNSSYPDYSHLGDRLHTANEPGVILDYAEVCFMLAEANERGYNVGGDAATWYGLGIAASMAYWTDATLADLGTYMAQPTVAYATAGATWQEKIGKQKYLALYGRGFEAWSSWRMLDFPNTFTRPVDNPIGVPRRVYYPNAEPQLNGANYDAAVAAMGGDELDSRVFWDINGQGN